MKSIPNDNVVDNTNIIYSHSLYKIKVEEDEALRLETCNDLSLYKHSVMSELNLNYAMFPPFASILL